MAAIMSRSRTEDKARLRVIDLGSKLALDSLAVAIGVAETLGPGNDPVVVLVDPIEPFLCIGANQDIPRTIDLSFCREMGIRVLRRPLVGGAIYIDRDQLVFHVIVPAAHAKRPAAATMPT